MSCALQASSVANSRLTCARVRLGFVVLVRVVAYPGGWCQVRANRLSSGDYHVSKQYLPLYVNEFMFRA